MGCGFLLSQSKRHKTEAFVGKIDFPVVQRPALINQIIFPVAFSSPFVDKVLLSIKAETFICDLADSLCRSDRIFL